ncbi:hypothetical protein HBH98_182760 [Parastagonospora nodorum]|nr:hypothetical protein HBH53_230980 [Parastagonospora nodorum]KAH3956687.1 hypothetical protein HBH51_237370 [Parastagonospora nodorum]KAH4215675.1 hypothetical protein HBI06_244140 [Parastagonospora nodorum]KAH4224455.1 hypothetical protein HBI05_236400 [Parastagonospora nodorum]KAH4341268.1 hypothetical protein HBH98_182760 [Parastagonospora nodorum]
MAKFYKDIRKYNHRYQWKAWALSGTPMEQGLNEILIFVSLALIGLQDEKGISNWLEPSKALDKVTDEPIYKFKDKVYESIAKTSSRQPRSTALDLNGIAMAKQWRRMIANVKHEANDLEVTKEYKDLIAVGAEVAQRFMLKRTLKTRDPWSKPISGIKGDFLTFFQGCKSKDFLRTVEAAEQQCKDVMLEEGLDPAIVTKRRIFNRSEMQAIASYPALATLKATQFKAVGSNVSRFTSDSVKDVFDHPDGEGLISSNLSTLLEGSAKFEVLKEKCSTVQKRKTPSRTWSSAAEEEAKAANTPLPPKNVPDKIVIGLYKTVVQGITWAGLRKEYGSENVLVMQGGMTQQEIDRKLAKWRDPAGPWIMVASMAFAEAITLTEATHVVIMEPQDRQNTQDQFMFRVYRLGQLADYCVGIILFNPDSELELKVLNKQNVKTTSRDELQGVESTTSGYRVDWQHSEPIPMSLEALS